MSRFVFASDLHGQEASYDRLFALEADAIVLGGDLLPHPRGAGKELLDLQRRFAGEFLAPRLRSRPCWWIPGNDDWEAALAPLEGAGTPIHECAVPFLDGYSIAGYSCVPVTPFGMKDFDRRDREGWEPPVPPSRCLRSGPEGLREVPLEEVLARDPIARDLERLGGLSDPARTVYVMHSPPLGSGLDVLWDGTPLGSAAIRAFIEARRPPLTLHGHIHESPGVVRLGATVCANPGDGLRAFRALRVDLGDLSVTPLR
jgi:Icc-related predicted phosphoesterase